MHVSNSLHLFSFLFQSDFSISHRLTLCMATFRLHGKSALLTTGRFAGFVFNSTYVALQNTAQVNLPKTNVIHPTQLCACVRVYARPWLQFIQNSPHMDIYFYSSAQRLANKLLLSNFIMTTLLTSSLQYCLLPAVLLIYDHLRISKHLSLGWIHLCSCVLRHTDKFIYVVTDDAHTHE